MGETTSPEGTGGLSASRRALLKGAGVAAGAVWVAPAVDSFFSPAAAASGTATVELRKSVSGNTDPPLSTVCTDGAQSNTGRGSVTFVRSESAGTICATITISSGPGITGRSAYILQSNGSGCLGGTTTAAGTWAASPANGPQQFCAPIIAGATMFVVTLVVSGGGGTDSYASFKVSLP